MKMLRPSLVLAPTPLTDRRTLLQVVEYTRSSCSFLSHRQLPDGEVRTAVEDPQLGVVRAGREGVDAKRQTIFMLSV